jgi:hemoglobin
MGFAGAGRCAYPAAFTPAHGNTCMRTRHFLISIDEAVRVTWLEKLIQAMDETGFPQELH